MTGPVDRFECISPIDYRYWDEEAAKYLSEEAFIRDKLKVEAALVEVLGRRGLCSAEVVAEVVAACGQVTVAEVYEEEKITRHDIQAMVNCICRRVSDEAKRFVHLMVTSYDIVSPANALRYRAAVNQLLLPALMRVEELLIKLALREKATPQIGRTHGQHAVPITVGFAIASYVSRLGGRIEKLPQLVDGLRGKLSGPVGAYNALSLFFDDPEKFEAEVLAELGLKPAEHSTQIVPPEALTELLCQVTAIMGVFANLADDKRHLQRTEIGEFGEEFAVNQVGSTAMPQKRNPVGWENLKSLWKVIVSRILTVFLDQLSEHQRDLTNSASSRTYPEIIAYAVYSAKRLAGILSKLRVDRGNLRRNLLMQGDLIAAEPLRVILAFLGHPNAHEIVRQLTLQAQSERRSLMDVVASHEELSEYQEKMTPGQRQVLSDPATHYTGIAAQKAEKVALNWAQKLNIEIKEVEVQ